MGDVNMFISKERSPDHQEESCDHQEESHDHQEGSQIVAEINIMIAGQVGGSPLDILSTEMVNLTNVIYLLGVIPKGI